jgi:hypothetical protein
MPKDVRAILSNLVTQRPGPGGELLPCETWDNAALACEVDTGDQRFPLFISTKRIAPGEMNTWFIRVLGMEFSAVYSTKTPKTLSTLSYKSGGPQAWQAQDTGYESAYPAITGGIFEFGFPDAILQMWAAYCDELVNGRESMAQAFYCATPAEASWSHDLFTAALASQASGETVAVSYRTDSNQLGTT